jgi:transposase
MTPSLEFAAFIGIDWADEKHDVCLLPPVGGVPQSRTVAHRPTEIAAWAAELRQRFGGRPVAVCLEQSRGALICALMQYDFLVLFPLNPLQLAAYRKALSPSGTKNDPTDAELLAQFLRDHRDKLRAWRPDDEVTRGLRLLTEQRRHWVEDRVALGNQLLQRVKESYVLALEFQGAELHGEQFLSLLEKFPSQRELQRASPKQLEKWLPKRRRRADDPPADEVARERIAAIRAALPITKDAAVLAASRMAVVHLVAMLRSLNRAIADCEQTIAELLAKHPDAEIFTSFPGAGKTLVPRLIAAFGSDREKFGSAQDVQQFSGIAPVTKSSGKTRVVQMRWACPKFLRQTFHEYARCSAKCSHWAKAYLAMLRAQGHRYQQALRSLAFKWQRIMFRCWQTRQPYNEDRYLQRLRATHAPLLAYLAPDPIPTA